MLVLLLGEESICVTVVPVGDDDSDEEDNKDSTSPSMTDKILRSS